MNPLNYRIRHANLISALSASYETEFQAIQVQGPRYLMFITGLFQNVISPTKKYLPQELDAFTRNIRPDVQQDNSEQVDSIRKATLREKR